MSASANYIAILDGHLKEVTATVTCAEKPHLLIYSSHDRTLVVWRITNDKSKYGVPERYLRGHKNAVSDVLISSDGQHVLSASWDCTLRLWDVSNGLTTKQFLGHAGKVLSAEPFREAQLPPKNRNLFFDVRDALCSLSLVTRSSNGV